MTDLIQRAKEALHRYETDAQSYHREVFFAGLSPDLARALIAARNAIANHAEPIQGTPYQCGPRGWLEVFDNAIRDAEERK